jgi:teichuronic acid biosynthesis glycosyltransferase TuaG
MKVPVSVVIPCYECHDTVAAAVESVARQTALPEELLLIDDASPDNGKTIDTLNAIKDRVDQIIHIIIIRLDENKGPAHARNVGWEAASQPYIAFLDADDTWHPQKLEITYSIMERSPVIDLIGHDFYLAKDHEGGLKVYPTKTQPKLFKKHFLSILLINPFVTPSFLLKRNISERFNPLLRYCEDHEFLLRVSNTYNIYHLKLKLAQLGREPFVDGGLTAKRTRMRMGEIAMYFEALKYRKGLVVLLPVLILFSMIKHATLLGLSYLRGKSI